MLRTPDIELDSDFEFVGTITKTEVAPDGRRYITGVASGVDEDLDGERCSKRCIGSMIGQVRKGGIAVTGSHQQDWMTTFGDVAEAFHDAQTGEMIVKAVLPPAGEDAIADKAFRRVTDPTKPPVGWSIGGKLKAAYFERNEMGKRRKVLDDVKLRHLMLTEKPAYAGSFAQAVAKTFDHEPGDADFSIEETADDVGKAETGPSAGDSGADSKTGDRNAGASSKGAPMKTDDDEPKPNLDKSPERHLACPNCGHEFAADLPADRNESTPQENLDDTSNREAKKTARKEIDMPLTATVEKLTALLDPDVQKTDTTGDDIGKTTALAVVEMGERFEQLEGLLGTALDTIAKSIGSLNERVIAIPQGRKSVARIVDPSVGAGPGRSEGPGEKVEKSLDERVDEAPTAVAALKELNAARGIR